MNGLSFVSYVWSVAELLYAGLTHVYQRTALNAAFCATQQLKVGLRTLMITPV
jgi:hypothetical protein